MLVNGVRSGGGVVRDQGRSYRGAHDLRRQVPLALVGQPVQLGGQTQRLFGRDGKFLQTRPCELVEVLEGNGGLPRPSIVDRAALVVEHLLHPEAGRGAVEQPEHREVIRLRGPRRQLDDRRGLFEHLAAAIQDEVVVGRDEGKGCSKGFAKSLSLEPAPLVPRKANFLVGTIGLSTPHQKLLELPQVAQDQIIRSPPVLPSVRHRTAGSRRSPEIAPSPESTLPSTKGTILVSGKP